LAVIPRMLTDSDIIQDKFVFLNKYNYGLFMTAISTGATPGKTKTKQMLFFKSMQRPGALVVTFVAYRHSISSRIFIAIINLSPS